MGKKRTIKKTNGGINISIGDAFTEFISEKALGGLTDSTIIGYVKSLRFFLEDVELNEDAPIESLDKEALLKWIAKMHADGKKHTTINNYLRNVRVFAYWCMAAERRYIVEYTINQLRGQEPAPKAFKKNDIEILLEKPRKSDDFAEWRTWIIVNWVMATGNRAGTICEVRLEDIDLKRKVVALRHTKSKQYQSIPISTELAHQLKEYINLWLRYAEPGDYLFPNVSGEALTYNALRLSFTRYCHNRGVNQTNIHGLRHSFAEISLDNGRNPFELQKLLGHSTLDMTRKYIRLHDNKPSPNFDAQTPLDSMKKPTSRKRKIQRTI